MNLIEYIKDVPDFPKPGIIFKDITPVLENGEAFRYAVKKFVDFARETGAELIVGPEARGFIFGCPTAYEIGIGFVPIRKPGKLPRETIDLEYSLEYGSNSLSIHKDAIKPGQKVLIVDDLLATGGTVKATADLIEKLGGIVVGTAFLIELDELRGRDLIAGYQIMTLVNC